MSCLKVYLLPKGMFQLLLAPVEDVVYSNGLFTAETG